MSIVLTSEGETVPSQASKSTELNEPLRVLQEGTDDERKHQSRTIDDFFAHAHNTVRLDHRPFFLAKRVPYYLVYVALALVNIGNTAATTSMGFQFAYESFEGISRGREGVIASSYYLGACIGGFLGGVISDIIGRRPVLLAGLFLTSSVGLLSAFASETWSFSVCRAIVGFGVGAIMPSVSTLASEHSPPAHRGGYSNFVNAFWTLGTIYSASMALLLLRNGIHWRYYALSAAIPSILAFPMIFFFVPESSRFLALHGRFDSAREVANGLARTMQARSMSFRSSSFLSLDELEDHYPRKASTKEISSSFFKSTAKAKEAYMDLYREPEIRKKVLVTQALWFFVFVGYGVSYWITLVFSELPFVKNAYLLSVFFSLASIPGLLLSGWIIDKYPRIHLLRGALVMAIISLAACAFFATATTNTVALLLATSVFNSVLATCWAALSLATTESFPTCQRSGVTGVCTASGKLGFIVLSCMSAFFLKRDFPAGPLVAGGISFLIAAVLTLSGLLMVKPGAALQDIVEEPAVRTSEDACSEKSSDLEPDDDPSSSVGDIWV